MRYKIPNTETICQVEDNLLVIYPLSGCTLEVGESSLCLTDTIDKNMKMVHFKDILRQSPINLPIDELYKIQQTNNVAKAIMIRPSDAANAEHYYQILFVLNNDQLLQVEVKKGFLVEPWKERIVTRLYDNYNLAETYI